MPYVILFVVYKPYNLEQFGQLGDSFGFITALLTAFALLYSAGTLRAQVHELEETRKQHEKSVGAQQRAAEIQAILAKIDALEKQREFALAKFDAYVEEYEYVENISPYSTPMEYRFDREKVTDPYDEKIQIHLEKLNKMSFYPPGMKQKILSFRSSREEKAED